METVIRTFDQLTAEELYEILRVRVAVFVVEQKCAYQEADGMDPVSLHVFFREGKTIKAYLRAFPKEPGTVQMGRVLTMERGKGLGGELLKTGIRVIRERMDPERIYIEAQCYAAGFYAREGFRVCSEEFLEDGIPHVGMVLELKET